MKYLSLILLLTACDTQIPGAMLNHIFKMCENNGGVQQITASAPSIVNYYCANGLKGTESVLDRRWEK